VSLRTTFLPLPINVGIRNADARGTEAVKLSVKWLAGFAVLALAVVAVIGSTSSTKAAAGSIFVANEWAGLTNESPAPSGTTTNSSATFKNTGTVFATFSETGRLTETDADVLRIVVKDAGADTATTQALGSANITVTSGGVTEVITAAAGSEAVIEFTGKAGTLISGTLASVQANTTITATNGLGGASSELNNDEITIVGFYAGSATNAPWIKVLVNVAGATPGHIITAMTYKTSAIDSVFVTIKSELDTTGVTIHASEDGLSTGRFIGYIQLVSTAGTSAGSGTNAAYAARGKIRTSVGPITTEYTDTDAVKRSTTASVDKTAPTASVTGPTTGSSTQNRRPTFSGTVSETGAGLDISTVTVVYDDADDAANTNAVINATTGVLDNTAVALPITTTGSVDGTLSFSFSQAPSGDIPSTVNTTPDHIVDWSVKATDLAGNTGISDSDSAVAGNQVHTVKIDQTIPTFSGTASDHKTGKTLDAANAEIAAKNALKVVFNDQVQNINASDFVVTLDSSATIVPSDVKVKNDAVAGKGAVYLIFANDLNSNETPTVALQDNIQDLAGNSTSTGSTNVTDGIAPTLTVTTLSGSGTGTGAEDATSLTKNTIKIRVSSDEPLASAPTVNVHIKGDVTAQVAPAALSQGTNLWEATYTVAGATGDRAAVVTGTDTATNAGTSGAYGTKTFGVDTGLTSATLSIGGGNTTSQLRPFTVIDFGVNGEASTVTLAEVLLVTGTVETNITTEVVRSSNNVKFFWVPTADLALGAHTIKIKASKATDAAANTNASDISLAFTIAARTTFDIQLFAGWNAVSFPADPITNDIGDVITNAGHDAVLGWDPKAPGQWRVATRDSSSGNFATTSRYGLKKIVATQAYWVHSNNFEPVKVLLAGETLPGSGTPPPVKSIGTVSGMNAIPVVSSSGAGTTGAAATLTRMGAGNSVDASVTVDEYITTSSKGHVYVWNPETLNFELQAGGTAVKTGTVLFVELIPDATGSTQPIFP